MKDNKTNRAANKRFLVVFADVESSGLLETEDGIQPLEIMDHTAINALAPCPAQALLQAQEELNSDSGLVPVAVWTPEVLRTLLSDLETCALTKAAPAARNRCGRKEGNVLAANTNSGGSDESI